jgi:DNA-directed RNA polymerase subunit RPC12/RpoP
MYLKIETEYRTYILRVTDIRNVSTGHDGNYYVIYVCYRCGASIDSTLRFDNRDERDEACEKIYQALLKWEGMME